MEHRKNVAKKCGVGKEMERGDGHIRRMSVEIDLKLAYYE